MYPKNPQKRKKRRYSGTPPAKNVKRKSPRNSNAAFITKTIFLSSIVVGVLCMIVFNNMQITTLSDKTASLKKQLSARKDENVQLKYKYENVYSAAAVEEYAQTRLGMTIMDKNYIEYIELPGEDKVERPYSETKGEFLILSRISEGIDTIVEYLN